MYTIRTGLKSESVERNHMAEALAISESFLHSLIEHLPIYIYRKDREGRFTFANKLFCDRYRRALEEILGCTDFDLTSNELAVKYRQMDQAVLETGRTFESVEEQVTPDGDKTYIQILRVPVVDNQGHAIGTQGMFRDVTRQKQAEADLEKANRELIDISRMAGMAEVATGVLHNVGNVLNSVNVSATLVADTLNKSKSGNIARVAGLLHENAANLADYLTNDPRGRQIPSYLSQLAGHLATEQDKLLREIELIRKNVDHIKEIVAMQQSYAKILGVPETVLAADLVEDALRMNAGSLVRHDIQIVREFDPGVTRITVEKHKVLQILVNLIRNAKNACDESGRADKQLTIRLTVADGHIHIAVIDNGVGIPGENLTRIFSHGFTTRKDGHGFGLHSGALGARELGGELKVHSHGPGHGATFTLVLPSTPPEKQT